MGRYKQFRRTPILMPFANSKHTKNYQFSAQTKMEMRSSVPAQQPSSTPNITTHIVFETLLSTQTNPQRNTAQNTQQTLLSQNKFCEDLPAFLRVCSVIYLLQFKFFHLIYDYENTIIIMYDIFFLFFPSQIMKSLQSISQNLNQSYLIS